MMPVLMKTDDAAIVQFGQDVLKRMISLNFDALFRWRGEAALVSSLSSHGNTPATDSHVSGVYLVLLFILRCLAPDQDESFSVFIGGLIVKMIQRGHTQLAQSLPDVFSSVVQRLETAKRSTLIQSLVNVFSHTIKNDWMTHALIDYLSGSVAGQSTGQTGLEIVLRSWCDNFIFFTGFYDVKVSIFALTKLYDIRQQDSRISGMIVKGDLVSSGDNCGRIKTRSRARQEPDRYTEIPFTVKVIKLLLNEYLQQEESRMAIGRSRESSGRVTINPMGDEGEEDEDDEDEEEWEDMEDEVAVTDTNHLMNRMMQGQNMGYSEENDDEDPSDSDEDEEIKQDPLYSMDMKQYIRDFIQRQAHDIYFRQLCEQYLTYAELQQLKNLLS